jgi:hypothetical protein
VEHYFGHFFVLGFPAAVVEKEAVTFLKKSNQKTFAKLDRGCETRIGPV